MDRAPVRGMILVLAGIGLFLAGGLAAALGRREAQGPIFAGTGTRCLSCASS